MTLPDLLVLAAYFLAMAAIGFWSSRRVKGQEDFFLGGRSFGKIMQSFAAFGAGTGSSDPVNTARTTFTSGMSGMWSVMYWLFVTPFYWFAGVWYRRMRHYTLGDWFVERYQSRSLGAAYTVFGLVFYMVYAGMLFTAVGKVAAPLVGVEAVEIAGTRIAIEHLLIPVIAVVVCVYGVLGGLKAAYWTDLAQGIFIILLSVMLIPAGLRALVERFGDPAVDGWFQGFVILHERVPEQAFRLVSAEGGGEFPLYRILAVVLINLVGIVVQPHFIATGGGSARTEFDARVGLVTGNFIKRFCTVGWALTALIALSLFAGHPELARDPDRVWGVASRELLPPGMVGLMLACLLAALMSSLDCYMVVGSALVVRNLYIPYFRPGASDREGLRVGRWAGGLIVAGAVAVSLATLDVFAQLQLTWIIPMGFAAPFWLGLFWRRATAAGAWAVVAYAVIAFAAIPMLAPRLPGLNTRPALLATTPVVETVRHHAASASDLERREADRARWREQAAKGKAQGAEPAALALGDPVPEVRRTGGRPLFWSGAVESTDPSRPLGREVVSRHESPEGVVTTVYRVTGAGRATGFFQPDTLLLNAAGVDLASCSDAMLDTLTLPPKVLMPFLVMVAVSLLTRRPGREGVDRYFAKMRTPVLADPEQDRRVLAAAQADPEASRGAKWFPNSEWEFQRPDAVDVIGFLASFAVCFVVIAFAAWVAGIGG